MRVKRGSLVFLLVFSMLICLLSFPVSAAAGNRVLLIQKEFPWGFDSNTILLSQLRDAGKFSSYDVSNFTDAGNTAFDLTVYKVVIIANNQSQFEYDQYNAAFKTKLETYASAGGVVLFGACDQPRVSTLKTALPGSVINLGRASDSYRERNNYIVDYNNPVVTGVLSSNSTALTDADLVGNSCSHEAFDEASLPAGTNVILRASISKLPTLVEYPLGKGHIIASGLTWEYYYSYNGVFAVKAFDDLFLYALSLWAANQEAPIGLLGDIPSVYGAADGKITGTTAAMEYKLSTGLVYTPATETEITGLAAGTYDVRYAAKVGFNAGDDAVVNIAVGPNANQDAPSGLLGVAPLAYSGADGKITGTTAAMEYKLSTNLVYTPATETEITGLAAGTYNVRYAVKVGFNAGADAVVNVAAGPNASQTGPSGLLGVAPMAYGAADGKITGTTTDMEYKLSADAVYIPATELEITGLAAGTYNVRYAAKAGFNAGDDAVVNITAGPNASQSAPSGLLGVAPLTYGASDGKITGTTTAMEYKLSSDSVYTPATVTEIKVLAAGTYNVRYAVKVGFNAGADAVVNVAAGPNASQTSPSGLLGVAPLTYGASDGKITGTTPAMEYKLSSDSVYIQVTGTEIIGLAAGTYNIRYAAKAGLDAGAEAVVNVAAGPNANQSTPSGLVGVAPLTNGGTDGKITGTTAAMEYKLLSVAGITTAAVPVYIPATGAEIRGLAAGTYSVRYAAKVGFNAGADAVVNITASPNANQTAPAGLAVVPSAAGGAVGKITGITPAMEYKLSTDSVYIPVTGTEITGLAAGVYDVRYAAKEGYNAGATATVIVSDVLAASIAAPTTAVSAAAPAAIAATGEHDNNMITGLILVLAAGFTLRVTAWKARKSNVQ